MTTQIKIGDYIRGSYKFGCIAGVVSEVKKNTVVVNVYREHYQDRIKTDKFTNVTITRIREINP